VVAVIQPIRHLRVDQVVAAVLILEPLVRLEPLTKDMLEAQVRLQVVALVVGAVAVLVK
jgi:capsule polysaccharide export protein KpsC/LpsZ